MGKSAQLPFSSRLVRGIGYELLAISIWGLWLALTRLGVNTSLNPDDITAIRFCVSGLILIVTAKQRMRRSLMKQNLSLLRCSHGWYLKN